MLNNNCCYPFIFSWLFYKKDRKKVSRSCWCAQAGHQMSLCWAHGLLFVGAMCSHVDCLFPPILLLNHCFSGSSCLPRYPRLSPYIVSLCLQSCADPLSSVRWEMGSRTQMQRFRFNNKVKQMNNKNHPEGEKQAGRKKTGAQSNMKLTWRKTTDQHRTADTRRLYRETNEGNEGDSWSHWNND